MKFYRRMSFEEFKKFINGETLVAYNNPSKVTTAKKPKFYFSGDISELVKYRIDNDVICEFESDEILFEKGYGDIRYSFNYGELVETEKVLEYHISEYNNKKMKLTNCVVPELLKILTDFHSIQYFKQKKDRTITTEFLQLYEKRKFYKDFLNYIDVLNFTIQFKGADLYWEYWKEEEELDRYIEEKSDYLLYGEIDQEQQEDWYDENEEDDEFLDDEIDEYER